MATAEEQLSIKVTSEGLKESTKDLRELEAAVTETASAASTGGKTVTTAVSVTAQDVKKATSDIVAAVDRVRTSNATAFQGLSSDVRTAAASIKGSLDQIKVSNEASSQAVVAAIERIGASMTEVAQKYNESAEKMKESTGGLEQKAGGLKDVAGSLAAAWAGAAGTRAFVTGTLEAAASMESLEKAFKAAGGSAQQFEEVKRMAADTPVVDNQTAVNAVAAFSRMGYSIDEAKDKVKTLANAAAYFGKNSSDMERAIVQIEQLAGKTTGFSGDLLAISNALPDVRQRLNEAFGTETVEEIQELGVTGQDVAEMLVASYGELPEVTAGTQESLDSLGASFEEIKAGLGKAFIPALQLVASWLTNVADAIKAMPNWLKNLIAWSTAAA
ncbi:MAG: tape measure protein, partial [Abditibacteriota bacterium]|nr:tape measure protein [Abditibacteriota bacterium]